MHGWLAEALHRLVSSGRQLGWEPVDERSNIRHSRFDPVRAMHRQADVHLRCEQEDEAWWLSNSLRQTGSSSGGRTS